MPQATVAGANSGSSSHPKAGVEFRRFCLVGTIGFGVDACVLYVLMYLGLSAVVARGGSFACAVTCTWLLNRRYTFRPAAGQSVVMEFLRYVSSMSAGALLNLAAYAWVVHTGPDTAWMPLVGVAIGSVVGLSANFLSARYWVFKRTSVDAAAVSARSAGLSRMEALAVGTLLLLFCAGALRDLHLPGLYMDAVNPEYLVARILNPELRNPVFAMPTATVPLLGNLYHGVQNLYVSLPFLAVLGFSMPVLRLSQALFGAGIVVMVYLLLRRASLPRPLAWLTAAALATELAFIASFRTQFHIVLAGAFWLLCALWWALPSQDDASQPRPVRPFASGMAFGLSVYAYFVYLFFLPVWLWAGRRRLLALPASGSWIAGFVTGMAPYALGYLSLAVELGGGTATWQWIEKTVTGLAPTSSSLGWFDVWGNLARNLWYALTNTGNELMMFGAALPATTWNVFKPGLLLGLWVLSGVVLAWRARKERFAGSVALMLPHHLAWMPLSFVLLLLPLGNRVWIHHFSVLVPLLYLSAGLLLAAVRKWSKVKLGLVAASAVLFMGLNLQQQAGFFTKLDQTGGVGKMSDALSLLAEDARRAPAGTVYVLSEWGFLMPFSLLTANKVPYLADLRPDSLSALRASGGELRIPSWSGSDRGPTVSRLNAEGWAVLGAQPYLQRDRAEAFRVLVARPCSQVPCTSER